MVSCCVNPNCRTEFRVFNTGEIYALDRRSANTEFFWLCSACVRLVALRLDSTGCVSVEPRSEIESHQPPHPDSRLRLVSRVLERTPWLQASRARGLMVPGGSRRSPFSSSPEAA